MTYTEIRNIKDKKYYYRVISIRKNNKISKKRIYLGSNLSQSEVLKKQNEADQILKPKNKELEKIKPTIIKILKNKVDRAGIFGSYSQNKQTKNSDIDIVINIKDKKMSLIGFIKLNQELEKALKRKVDLVEYNAIKPRIKERILKEEIKII